MRSFIGWNWSLNIFCGAPGEEGESESEFVVGMGVRESDDGLPACLPCWLGVLLRARLFLSRSLSCEV